MPTYEYEGPVEITELPITVKALATRTGYLNSAVATANYTQAKVATPAFTPVTGSYPYPVTVTITCATSGASIKYSVDGSEPSLDYTVPLSVSSNTPVKAKAVKTDWLDSDVASVVYEHAQVPVVTFTPGSSAVVFPQIVYLATVLSGTTIYYTVGTNPPDPTTSDILYDPDDGVELVAAGVIKAFAIKTGYIDSDVNSATYTQVVVATPTISQSYSPGGGYWYPNTITLACATSGSTIRYTTDGSTPTGSSTLYSAPFAITSSVTVKAKAFKSGYADSDVASRLYDQQRVTTTPTISQSNAESGVPNPTSPLYPTVVTLAGESGSTFYYTTDGSTPDNTDTLYSAPFNNTGQTPIKAIAYKTDYLPSAVATQAYTQRVVVTPTFSHPGGEIILGSTVSISTTTPNCTIYYTVDGSTPDNTDTVYSGPVTIGSALTLKAIAYKTGGFQPGSWAVSAVATASYTGPLSPAPTISPNGSGEYEFPVRVLISTASPVDAIYYTTDGSTPDNTDTLYNGYFEVDVDGTVVKAITVKAGYSDSSVTTVTINQATVQLTAVLDPAANSAITDGQVVNSVLSWKTTAGGALESSSIRSVGVSDYIYQVKSLRNGKYMACGNFLRYGHTSLGYAIKHLVRINQDMTPDVNWRSTVPDFNDQVFDFTELSDGSIVAVGLFTSINGVSRSRICKFNADGTLSNTFTTALNNTSVYRVVANKDDKILVIGTFSTVTPTGGAAVAANNMVILNADGTIAANVSAGLIAPTSTLYAYLDYVCAAADGGFLIAGQYYHPSQGYGVVKLAANGTWVSGGAWLAPMTNYNSWAGRRINVIKPLRDGRAVIGGTFATGDFFYTPASNKNKIAILGTNGAVDDTFVAPALSTATTGTLNDTAGYVLDIEQTRSNKLFVVGSFRSAGMTSNSSAAPYNRHHSMTLLNLDGTIVSATFTNNLGEGVTGGTIAQFRRLALTPNDEPIVLHTNPSTGYPATLSWTNNQQSLVSASVTGLAKFHLTLGGSPTYCLTLMEDYVASSGLNKFTVNGSDPVLASAVMPGGGISLNQTAGVFPPLKVRAVRPYHTGAATNLSGFKLGAISTSTYTWAQVATPVANPGAGGIAFGTTITLTCATSGAAIWYTTDGSTPTDGGGTSTLYSTPVAINSALTLKAIAYKANYLTSAVLSAAYTQLTVATPVLSPTSSAVKLGTPVTITCATSGAKIWYTDDGADPINGLVTPAMTNSNAPRGLAYSSTTSGTNFAYKAFDRADDEWTATGAANEWVAYAESVGPREVLSYKIVGGATTANSPVSFELQGSDNGTDWTTVDTRTAQNGWSVGEERTYNLAAPARYVRFRLFISTIDGGTNASIRELKLMGRGLSYTDRLSIDPGGIRINEADTIKAGATKTGCIDSAVATESYTQDQVATPVATPVGSAIQFGSTVALSCSAPSGSQINYTVDGSDPLPRGPVGRWPMNGNGTDTIGGINGTVISASFVSGGIAGGQCLSCTGGLSYMNMINSANQAHLNMAGKDFSIVIWVKTASTATNSIIVSKHQPGSANGYMLGMNSHLYYGSTNKAFFYVSNTNGNDIIGSVNVNDDAWHQVVGVYGHSGYQRIYIDGGLESYDRIKVKTSQTGVNNATQLQVPGNGHNGGGTFVGKFNDLQIYDRALTPAEIAYLYANPGSVVGDTETLRYATPITVSAAQTIKAIALKADYLDSGTMSEAYTQATLANVVFDPVSGTSGASLITLTNAVSGTTIRYTIDGSTPTISNGFTYSGPFVIVTPKTVKAYAYKTGYIDSAVATATYP